MRFLARPLASLLCGVAVTLGATAAPQSHASPASAACGATPSAAASVPASRVASPVALGRPVSVAAAVAIEITDRGFEPAIVEATSGHPLTNTLRNIGSCRHGFRIDHFWIDVILDPSAVSVVVIQTPALGDFAFTSSVDGDEAMRGRLTFYI